MKFIRFSMRNKKDDFTLPMEKAEQILRSQQQTIMVSSPDGTWSGLYVNKADVTKTERDFEAERDWKSINQKNIEEPKVAPISPERLEEISGEVKEILKSKLI